MSLSSGMGLISGINFSDIISKLRSANSQPIVQVQKAQSKIETQRNTMSAISEVLKDFQTKAESLSKADNFLSLTAQPSDFTVMTATATGTSTAAVGTYNVAVKQLAQAHRIASQGVTTLDSTPIASGGGTFQLRVGNGTLISVDLTAGTTLQELRDKINSAEDTKVRASIVSDGTATQPYRMVLTATETGQDNAITIVNNDTTLNLGTPSIEEPVASGTNAFNGTIAASGDYKGKAGRNIVMEITSGGGIGTAKYRVSLDGGVTWSADDAYTTAAGGVDVTGSKAEGVMVNFAPGETPVDFAVGDRFTIDTFVPELQKAQNAIIEVDGIQVSRSTNTFTDAIDGVTLTVKKPTTEVTTLKVENSSSGVASKIKEFVTAYNTLVDTVAKTTAYDAENKTAAALFGDSGVQGIINSLRMTVMGDVSGNTQYRTLSSIGITMDNKGHLSVDATKVNTALEKNLDEVKRLFVEAGNSTNSTIQFTKSSDTTKVGSYAVQVTTAARQATVTAGRTLEATGLSAEETLTLTHNEKTVAITLAAGLKLEQVIEALNARFRDEGLAVQASSDGGRLKLNSTQYGGDQTLDVFSTRDASAAGQLGIGTTVQTTTGTDVAGTINGMTATGSGQTLKGISGTDSAGLVLTITANAPTSGTLVLTHGVALGALQKVQALTDSKNGLFATREASYEARIKEYDKQIDQLTARLDAEEERMTRQFNALELKLSSMQSQGNFLLSQLSSLIE